MWLTHGTSKAPKLVHGRFSNRSWLETVAGEQLTPKFKLVDAYRDNGFILYTTSVGHFLCHVMQSGIIYQDSVPNGDISLQKVDEHMYKLVYLSYIWKVSLFTDAGKLINDDYTCVRRMNNELCATQKGGKYGFIDGDANVIVQFKYNEVSDFNDSGYAIVTYDDGKSTVIDKKGNELFAPINAYRMEFLTPELLKANMRCAGVGVVDLTGKEIIPCVYRDLWIRSGHIHVTYQNKCGLFAMDGTVEFECMYPEIIETPDKFVVQDFNKIEIPKIKEVPKHT